MDNSLLGLLETEKKFVIELNALEMGIPRLEYEGNTEKVKYYKNLKTEYENALKVCRDDMRVYIRKLLEEW